MNTIYISIIVSVLFFAFKFIESKMIRKEEPNKKVLVRDSLIAGISCALAHYSYVQFSNLATGMKTPHVFVGEPDF